MSLSNANTNRTLLLRGAFKLAWKLRLKATAHIVSSKKLSVEEWCVLQAALPLTCISQFWSLSHVYAHVCAHMYVGVAFWGKFIDA